MSSAEIPSERLSLRLTSSEKQILTAVAGSVGQTFGAFVVESALARAEELLPDRRRFHLDAEQCTAFLAALDAPPTPAPRLARLLREPSTIELCRKY